MYKCCSCFFCFNELLMIVHVYLSDLLTFEMCRVVCIVHLSSLTPFQSERLKLYTISSFLSAIGLKCSVVIYTPDTTQKYTPKQTPPEVSGLVDAHQETEVNQPGAEEMCQGTEGGTDSGLVDVHHEAEENQRAEETCQGTDGECDTRLVDGHHRAEEGYQSAERKCQGDDKGIHTELVDGQHEDESRHQGAEGESSPGESKPYISYGGIFLPRDS